MSSSITTTTSRRTNEGIIMSTANDAAQSKLSAVNKGYYKDPFIPYMMKSSSSSSSIPPSSLHNTNENEDNLDFGNLGSDDLIAKERMKRRMGHEMMMQDRMQHQQGNFGNRVGMRRGRSGDHHQPIIRRGTFARTCIMDYSISSFLALCHEQIIANENSEYQSDNNNDNDDERIQIVVLGSGKDTTYLRAKTGLIHGNDAAANALEDGIMEKVFWYEIDHGQMIQEKKDLLSSCPLLNFDFNQSNLEYGPTAARKNIVQENANNIDDDDDDDDDASERSTPTSFAVQVNQIHTTIPRQKKSSRRQDNPFKSTLLDLDQFETSVSPQPQYHLVGFDLCHPFSNLIEILEKHHSFKRNAPTLFTMECVQMYIPDQDSRNFLQTMTMTLRQPFIAIFDPIIQNDAFGKVMTQNLTKAKIITNPSTSTISLLTTTTLQEQIDKLVQCGFRNVTGCDFLSCFETIFSADNRRKANMTEMLDEIEEWILIMKHYCFVVGRAGGRIRHGDDGINAKNEIKTVLDKYCLVGNDGCLGFDHKRCVTTAPS